jgi:uncharacterized OB-fold protein
MVMYATDGRPLPRAIPTTKPYFDAAKEGRLRLQRCPRDGVFYYPRSRCPDCWQDDWEWTDLSGCGEVYSYTIDRLGHDPALAQDVPFVIALIDLEEGARVVASLIDCEPEVVDVGMRVQATFTRHVPSAGGDSIALLRFQPRVASSEGAS